MDDAKTCNACQKNLGRDLFSKAQWKKEPRRCQECVNADRPLAESPAAPAVQDDDAMGAEKASSVVAPSEKTAEGDPNTPIESATKGSDAAVSADHSSQQHEAQQQGARAHEGHEQGAEHHHESEQSGTAVQPEAVQPGAVQQEAQQHEGQQGNGAPQHGILQHDTSPEEPPQRDAQAPAQSHDTQSHDTQSHDAQSNDAQSNDAQAPAQSHNAQSHNAQSPSKPAHDAQQHSAQSHDPQTHTAQSHIAQSHTAQSQDAPQHSAPQHDSQTPGAPLPGARNRGHDAAEHPPLATFDLSPRNTDSPKIGDAGLEAMSCPTPLRGRAIAPMPISSDLLVAIEHSTADLARNIAELFGKMDASLQSIATISVQNAQLHHDAVAGVAGAAEAAVADTGKLISRCQTLCEEMLPIEAMALQGQRLKKAMSALETAAGKIK